MTAITLGQLAVEDRFGAWVVKCPNCGTELGGFNRRSAARSLGRHAREVSQCGLAIYRKTGVTE